MCDVCVSLFYTDMYIRLPVLLRQGKFYTSHEKKKLFTKSHKNKRISYVIIKNNNKKKTREKGVKLIIKTKVCVYVREKRYAFIFLSTKHHPHSSLSNNHTPFKIHLSLSLSLLLNLTKNTLN